MINHKQFQLIQIKFIKLNWGKSEPEKQNINCVTPITQSLYGTMFCFSCVDWVLIVEKETVFQSIIQTNFAEKYRCLIVTASRQAMLPIVWNNVDSKLICEFYAIYFSCFRVKVSLVFQLDIFFIHYILIFRTYLFMVYLILIHGDSLYTILINLDHRLVYLSSE